MLKFPSTGSEQTVAFKPNKVNAPGGIIFLPVPNAFTLKDGAAYSTIELGDSPFVRTSADLVAQGREQLGITSRVLGAGKSWLTSVLSTNLANRGLSKPAQGFIPKKIMSPQANTAFTGHAIRTFTFEFVLAPSSPEEASNIKAIIDAFRQNLYARSSDSIILDYPTNWKIEFLTHGIDHGRLSAPLYANHYYPRLWPAYMTGFTSNSNPRANGFYADGSPVEVEITLDFQETRALTQEDIIELESGANVGVGTTGLATTSQPRPKAKPVAKPVAKSGALPAPNPTPYGL